MQPRGKSRFAVIGVLALCGAMALAGPAEAKKKKSKKIGGTSTTTKTVNVAVPDGVAATDGLLESTISIGGKKFKGSKVRDVDVTFTTLGLAPASASDISAFLTAPNGATSLLSAGFGGQSIAGVTFTDETKVMFVGGLPPAPNPFTLPQPYAGSVQPVVPLNVMDGGNASGTWTLTLLDVFAGDTSTLSSWKLVVNAGAPFKT